MTWVLLDREDEHGGQFIFASCETVKVARFMLQSQDVFDDVDDDDVDAG